MLAKTMITHNSIFRARNSMEKFLENIFIPDFIQLNAGA